MKRFFLFSSMSVVLMFFFSSCKKEVDKNFKPLNLEFAPNYNMGALAQGEQKIIGSYRLVNNGNNERQVLGVRFRFTGYDEIISSISYKISSDNNWITRPIDNIVEIVLNQRLRQGQATPWIAIRLNAKNPFPAQSSGIIIWSEFAGVSTAEKGSESPDFTGKVALLVQ